MFLSPFCVFWYKAEVRLITNVLAAEKLPRQTASKFYRWQWRNEMIYGDGKGTGIFPPTPARPRR